MHYFCYLALSLLFCHSKENLGCELINYEVDIAAVTLLEQDLGLLKRLTVFKKDLGLLLVEPLIHAELHSTRVRF